jgi:putative methionine-R-sulfoxide reductase with GAF domain
MEKPSFSEILKSGQTRVQKARQIAEKIRAAGHYSWVGIYEVKPEEITIISFAGRTEPAFTSFPRNKGLNGRAVTLRRTVIVNDTDQDEDYLLTFSNTKAEIITPVFDPVSGEAVGTIDVESENKNVFGSRDIGFLEDCARAIQHLYSKAEQKQ